MRTKSPKEMLNAFTYYIIFNLLTQRERTFILQMKEWTNNDRFAYLTDRQYNWLCILHRKYILKISNWYDEQPSQQDMINTLITTNVQLSHRIEVLEERVNKIISAF